ncbi:MAG: ATP-dependent DNA helicase [Ruminococcaceae bacterium]|nr:ATP-dependent DNA helicase [Oscillospiraceae bacterium]
MKFDAKEKILRLTAEELVSLASARLGHDAPFGFPEALPALPLDGENTMTTAAFAIPAFSAEVTARAHLRDADGGTVLSRRFRLSARDAEGKKEETRLLRALGFVLCYAFSDRGKVSFCFYLEDEKGTVTQLCEAPDTLSLEKFFARLLTSLVQDASYEMERVTERLPSFLSVAFPYPDVREGQKDMMSAVYTAAKQGEMLFAMAPTGTGKTMAALFPALRAMGQGHIRKLFYLTPKNTSARAACEAVSLLTAKGMKLRALHLVAKERMCAEREARGECGSCHRRASASKNLTAALSELVEKRLPVVGERELSFTAVKHGTCPYRLAVAYGKYADLVIGDYNYLFDPNASPTGLFPTDRESFFLVDEAHNLPDRARETYSGTLDTAFFEGAISVFEDDAERKTVLTRLCRGFVKTVDHLLRDDLREREDGHLYGFARAANFPSAYAELLREGRVALEKQRISPLVPHAKEKRSVILSLCGFLERLEAYDSRFLTYAQRQDDARLLRFFCIDPSERIGERLSLGKGAVFFSATLSPIDYYRSLIAGNRKSVKIEVPSPFENGALCVGIMDKISVRASAREDTLPEIARVIVTAMKPRRGNYMVFCPSYDYMEAVAEAFHALTPKTPMAVQKRSMTTAEREAFLANFAEDGKGYFVGFCVSGGIFSEGVDLVGGRLIGTVVIGVGLPGISAERELISSYYGDLYGEGKEYAYLYPGLNRILQAAGRVIRREDDRGIAVLIDDRLRDEACRRVFPPTWRGLKYVGDRPSLTALLTHFWQEVDSQE